MATVEVKRKKSVSIIEPPNLLDLETIPPTKKESIASSSRRSSNASITESAISSRRSSLVPTKTRSRSGSRSDFYDYISGTYEFERFDDNLEEYLDSLGLSGSDLGTIVRQNKIRVEIKRPESADDKWSLTTTEYSKKIYSIFLPDLISNIEKTFSANGVANSHNVTYDIDKQYINSRNGNTEITTCSQPQPNVLVYTSKVPSNGWCIENESIFTPEGIIATIRNLNSNTVTTKYYRRSMASN
mgnify:CR=1 FL=1